MTDTLYEQRCGGWLVRFASAAAQLECRHSESAAVAAGELTFRRSGSGGDTWSIDVARDGVSDRLSLLDRDGNVQGYVVFVGNAERLEIRAVHRAAQAFAGRLQFAGSALLGPRTYACRAAPEAGSRVVQMASGPADSTLNDSLFDIDMDTVLRFAAHDCSLRTCATASGERPSFGFILDACIEDDRGGRIALDLESGFYRNRYVPNYVPIDKARCPSPPTGWMSWNVYFDTAGEEENLAEARVAAEHLRPFGLEVWSIESWQDNSDKLPVRTFHNLNLTPNAKQFPHGMKWLADQIRELGFKPGIWTAPFGTGNRAFYEEHKAWFLHDDMGEPMTNWCGLYVMDPTQEAVRRHMRTMHGHMAREWGYEFFKIDGMSGRGPGYSAHFFERPEVRQAFAEPCDYPFELCVQAFRAGIGEDRTFLACQGHYSGPEAAYADAARIGGDIVAPNQPSTWHNILSQARATLNQLFVHNIVWYSDPDTLLVGDYHSVAAARVTTAVVALPGQMMFAGDKLAELSAERMRLLQQSLPVCDVRPLDLFPIFALKPVWDLKVRRDFGDWDVVSLFNWADDEQTLAVRFAELGLPDEDSYVAFSFWDQAMLGVFSGEFGVTIPPRASLLLSIHRDTGRPQFLSTDRHVTQGGVSLRDLQWNEDDSTLHGSMAVVAGVAVRLHFSVPESYSFDAAVADGASQCTARLDGDGLLTVDLRCETTGTLDWSLRFG